MKAMFAIIALFSATLTSAGAGAEELTAEAGGDGSVQVICRDPETGMNARMRAGLIAHDGPGEIALTAAHGLRGRSQCQLSMGGRSVDLDAVRLGDGAGPGSDWAFVRSAQRLEGVSPRYRLAQVTGDTFNARMVSSRTLQPRCHVSAPPPTAGLNGPLAVHDCRVLPGRSGAPLVAGHNGERFIVAVNLGYLISPDEQFNNVAFARLVNQDMIAALNAISPP